MEAFIFEVFIRLHSVSLEMHHIMMFLSMRLNVTMEDYNGAKNISPGDVLAVLMYHKTSFTHSW